MSEFDRFCYWLGLRGVLSEEFKGELSARVDKLVAGAFQRGVKFAREEQKTLTSKTR